MAERIEIWDAELGYSATSIQGAGDSGMPVRPDGAAEPLWGVWLVNEANERGVHVFPHATLEWRAAEYAFDPDDVATLIDVILHEGAIPNPDDPLAYADPASTAILRRIHGLPSCFTRGVSDETRRQAHLERIAAVKEHRLQVVPAAVDQRAAALQFVGSARVAPADPLAPIKEQTRLDPMRVAGKRAFLDWHRGTLDGPVAPTFQIKPPSTFVGMQP